MSVGILHSIPVPLGFSALFFAVLATCEWRRMPICGRVYLGVATAFALGALTHPHMSINDVLSQSRDGVAYVVALARVAALTAVLVSVTSFLRELNAR
ncbi:MAG: hypothetical protein ACJ77M_20395 [Thermoleophilaceae bacterium]|jgi:hypothetical protein